MTSLERDNAVKYLATIKMNDVKFYYRNDIAIEYFIQHFQQWEPDSLINFFEYYKTLLVATDEKIIAMVLGSKE